MGMGLTWQASQHLPFQHLVDKMIPVFIPMLMNRFPYSHYREVSLSGTRILFLFLRQYCL